MYRPQHRLRPFGPELSKYLGKSVSSRRVDIRAILADPVRRRELMVECIMTLQAREGIETSREQAEAAYDEVERRHGMSEAQPFIWWLSQAEMEAIGPELPEGYPERLRDEYRSMWGRPLRGRLWGSPAGGRSVPPEAFETALGRFLAGCGGIVIGFSDLPLLPTLPGTVTDFLLNRTGVA